MLFSGLCVRLVGCMLVLMVIRKVWFGLMLLWFWFLLIMVLLIVMFDGLRLAVIRLIVMCWMYGLLFVCFLMFVFWWFFVVLIV